MPDRDYTCAQCGGAFQDGWTDEEAHAEAVQNFGRRGDEPGMVKVCDDCYRDIMADLSDGGEHV